MMPDFPPEVIQRAAEVRLRQYDSEFSSGHLSWQDFAGEVREMLDAVAPELGEYCARKITDHAERQHPRDPEHLPSAFYRHFGTAARVAARAFLTDDDVTLMAAKAVARGDFAACFAPDEDADAR